MENKDLVLALRNAAACGDVREVIALTNQMGEVELAQNPDLEEAYRMALAEISE